MNILPLVAGFILIFAIGSYAFVHNHLCSIQEREHFFGARKASHSYARTLQSKRYKKIKGKNLFPKESRQGTYEKTSYTSPRDRIYPHPEAKLNICPMIGRDNPKTEQLFITLIDELYRCLPHDKGESIGQALLCVIKRAGALSSLEEIITIADEKDREWVYKILKGTQNVHLEAGSGYPALGDYIQLGRDQEKSVHICHAARPLLSALCGPDISQLIINFEQEAWEPKHIHTPITRDQLISIFLAQNFDPSTIDELIDFSRKKEALDQEIIEAGGIKIRHDTLR